MNPSTSNQSTTLSSLATPKHRRKKTAEKWDDDFEFALPGKATRGAGSSSKGVTTTVTKQGGRSSPDSAFEESWDESPPPPPLGIEAPVSKPHIRTGRVPTTTRAPGPISIPSLPRSSSSQASSLPSSGERQWPSSIEWDNPSTTRPSIPDTDEAARPRPSRSRSGSVKGKLIKRHPSSSCISTSAGQHPDDAVHPPLPSRTASNLAVDALRPRALPRSDSGERMPPPPLTGQARHSRSSSKGRRKGTDDPEPNEVRASRIPVSPSMEQMNLGDNRRPSFWKRLSGAPSPKPDTAVQVDPTRQRRRSSSTTGKPPHLPTSYPPVPLIPANLRSPSTTSQSSIASASSTNRSSQNGFSVILRRSASSLSRRSDKSLSSPPPAAHPYASFFGRRSSSSINSIPPTPALPVPVPVPVPNGRAPQPAIPSSNSFSHGFHLPSPSPKSPYRQQVAPAIPPPIPHSASYAGTASTTLVVGSDTDTETEEDGRTPRRRRKIRPVSALPPVRISAGSSKGNGWRGNDWRGMPRSQSGFVVEDVQAVRSPPPALASPSPGDSNFSSGPAATLRRLGSISKKHGRRLSGGFKFGSSSSPSSPEFSRPNPTLETVMGSPTKIGRKCEEGDHRSSETRAADHIAHPDSPSASKTPLASAAVSSTAAAAKDAEVRMLDKQRRRQSWNDFVIPRSVLEKQKGLKENIGAVKKFAGGLETLKSLVDVHDSLHRRMNIPPSPSPDKLALFEDLEDEYGQWWEMATVLIEVGNTSTGTNRNSSDSNRHPGPSSASSPRSRRITLAADNSKLADEVLQKLSASATKSSKSASTPVEAFVPRNLSLPDPPLSDSPLFGISSPPRASPEQWRGSTGRQDLSRRQLEVLRTMLRTPVSDRPAYTGRQASTMSASSTLSNARPGMPSASTVSPAISSTAASRIASRATSTRDTSPIKRSASPADSPYVIQSGSFPSPMTASAMANPKRSSKAGLAGLRDFLRSIKSSRPSPNAPANAAGVSQNLPNVSGPSTFSPPTSPQLPSGPSPFDLPQYPIRHRADQNKRYQTHDIPPPSPTVSAKTSNLHRKDAKRPSLRNIFRSSSGNWSDLVKAERKSIDGESNAGGGTMSSSYSVPVGLSHDLGARAAKSGLTKLPSRADLGRNDLKLSGQHVVSPKSSRQNDKSIGRSKAATSTKQDQEREAVVGQDATRQSSDASDQDKSAVDDRTLRPRKSRIIGLGWPDQDQLVWEARSGEKLGSEHGSNEIDKVSRQSSNTGGQSRSTTQSSWTSTDGDSVSESDQHSTSEATPRTAKRMTLGQSGEAKAGERPRIGGHDQVPRMMETGNVGTGLETVVLTPENLPVLLDYLRTCEKMLGEWRVRVASLVDT